MVNLVLIMIINCLNGIQMKFFRKHVENAHSDEVIVPGRDEDFVRK